MRHAECGASGNALRCLIGSDWRDEVSKVYEAFVRHLAIKILLLSRVRWQEAF